MPFGLHRNSTQGLNISSIRFLTTSEIRKPQSPFVPSLNYVIIIIIIIIIIIRPVFFKLFVDFVVHNRYMVAKGDWDFQITDLVKNPDRTDI